MSAPPTRAAPDPARPTDRTGGVPRRRFTGWRKWVLRLALAVTAPVVVLGLLELGLRVFGYGHPTRFFVPLPDGQGYTVNRSFTFTFADPAIAPRPEPLILPAEKAPGTVRIFVLGESAAMGTPDPAYGFPRVLEVMLRERHPGRRFEVVNTAYTAINSHVILPIAEDCADHQPDLFVVYMGNNETIGPFGPGTVFRDFSPSRPLIRAGVRARSLRVGQLLGAALRPSRPDGPTKWKGMELFAASRVAPDDPRRRMVEDHFRANLAGIVEAGRGGGARVVLCTVGTNLRDCPPFASLHRSDLSDDDRARWDGHWQAGAAQEATGRAAEAVEAYRAAERIDDRHAELHYRLARLLLALGRVEDARTHFTLARDCDALQFRTDSRLNAVIREEAEGRDGVFLADVERALEQDPRGEHGLTGQALFWEHVHLRFEGNYIAAREVLTQVEAALGLADGRPVPSVERCAEELALTPFDRHRCAGSMLQMTSAPPFPGQFDHAARHAAQARDYVALTLSAADLERSRKLYEAAVARRPDDWQLRFHYGAFLLARGRGPEAEAQMRTVVDALHGDARAVLGLADALVAAGKPAEAADRYRDVLAVDPSQARTHKGLGDALALQNKPDEAAAAYEAAVQINPAYVDALNNLGLVRLAKGDIPGARARFEAVLAIGPDATAEFNLGNILVREGKLADALPRYRRACELQPASAPYQNNLGVALAATGKDEEAERCFRAAVALDPRYARAHAAYGDFLMARGRPGEALPHLRQAVANGHAPPTVLSALAWLLATAPDPAVRDGAEAVRLAEQACRLTGRRDVACLDALSAAYASVGRFGEALAAAREAVALAEAVGDARKAELIRRRLPALMANRPPHP